MASARTTTVIAISAVAIGVIADHLFRASVWGINVPLAAGMLAAAGMAMPSADRRPPWPWLAAVFFAAMWAVRDADELLAIDFLAALSLASLPLLQERSVMLRAVDLVELIIAPLRTAWAITIGTFGFAHVARTRFLPEHLGGGRGRAIGAGALLAAPLVLLFGGLFASADPVFDVAVQSLFDDTIIGPLVSHTITAGALAWATAGYLWTLAKPPRPASPLFEIPTIGSIPILTPLVATLVMFALFLGVQATSLFGGATFVETTTGLTFAEYARGGFFQLVFAATLVLPLLYFAPAIAGPLDERGTRMLRGVMGAQIALTGLVLASALWRMGLYIGAYGLTEDRVNGTAVMVWIAVTLGVFAFTVVRRQPRHAAFGSLVAAVAVLAALNLGNPQVMIARYNLGHQTGREIDFEHLARLGGDAVPVLAAQIDLVPAGERCRVITELRRRHLSPRGDWRGWNLARARAHDAVTTLAPLESCPGSAAPDSPAPAGR
ncbi:MAG: DUF4173 domain-containing protein [Gemmatimonadetes bacterium]|nr:DUF4173 domain-containing protein [Gemmatimonadota bacterium]